jgi:ADP-ribosyl-[dinitrogen reductase] hydrolase
MTPQAADPLSNGGSNVTTTRSRFRGALVGLAAGDAVGTTVEFKPRGSFPPVTDMVGGGPFSLPPGAWTDDTSMALCLATSLVECRDFDPHDQMTRYVRWMQSGYLSSIGRCFDIGVTTANALAAFQHTGEPYSGSAAPNTAGNGSIMRLAPVPLFFYPDMDTTVEYSGASSRTTHAAQECIDACRLFGLLLQRTLTATDPTPDKAAILFADFSPHLDLNTLAPNVREIARGGYRDKSVDEVQGSGYVIKSLEAALWAFWRTHDYRSAILAAVNLGDDADTTAAVCGQIAGAYYGYEAIPALWRQQLVMHDEICVLADQLYELAAMKR